jgi:putative redox protein
MEMYAGRKEWDLGQVEVAVDFTEATTDSPASFDVKIEVSAELDDEQRERLLVIAGKCPVHRALTAQDLRINDELQLIEG